MYTVLLLIASTTFMNIAWYGHLKYTDVSWWLVILISWLIALPEYMLQVPANRLGLTQYHFSTAQMKILAEAIGIGVFVIFNLAYFHKWPSWREGLAFVLIFGAVVLVALESQQRSAHG